MNAKDPDNQTKATGGLDLGLGSLLESEAASEVPEALEVLEQPESSAAGQSVPDLTEFESLYAQKRYAEIVRLAESCLENPESKNSKNSEWIESQAWWLISQISMRAFPAAVLEAPFDSFLETLAAKPEALQSEHLRNCCNLTVSVYANALVSEGSNRSVLQLISKIAEQSQLTVEMHTLLEKISVHSASMDSADRQLLSDLRLKLRMPGLSLIEEPVVLEEAKKETVPDSFGAESARKGYAGYFWIILILIAVALVVLINPSEQKEDLVSLLKSRVQSPIIKMQLPEPELTTEFSELDAMLYEVNRKVEHSEVRIQDIPALKQETLKKEEPIKPLEKVKINTSEPRESEELRKLRTQKPSRNEREASIVPGPAQAPHFKEFKSLRMYEVIRPTSLMSQPSPRSEAVAGLNTGDYVQVQGREGYWLRVISKQGKIAYVLAEDLQPSY